jgi:hypothetical protein
MFPMPTATLDRPATQPRTKKSEVNKVPLLDLDIRVVERPAKTQHARMSDFLTCKTDSTCDGSDAC